jgi:hypothetical protein
VEILQDVRRAYEKNYQHKWHLTITTTTNAIINKRKLSNIIPFIDEFTVSYHTQNSDKQKTLFKSNILDIIGSGKRLKCIVMMHNETDLFADAQRMIMWCEENHVRYLPKVIDYPNTSDFDHKSENVGWFNKMYTGKTFKIENRLELQSENSNETINISALGRACCGGRTLCKDKAYGTRDFFVVNKFPDWYCSVNEFFLYIKQTNGEIYTNKDCKMNFDGGVGPIGNLSDAGALLDRLHSDIKQKKLPVIQCKKTQCLCGLCAPKAKDRQDFETLMEKYRS